MAGYTTGTLPGKTSTGGQDAFVRKYGLSGDELWTRQFGSESDDITSGIAVDSTGVMCSGYTYGTFAGQTNARGPDVFVCKYDFDGNVLWTRQLGGTDGDFANHIGVGDSELRGRDHARCFARPAGAGLREPGRIRAQVRLGRRPDLDSPDRILGQGTGTIGADVYSDASGVYITGNTFGVVPGQTSTGEYGSLRPQVRP